MKAYYQEFIIEMIENHPQKSAQLRPSSVVRNNLTASEVSQMTGQELSELWDELTANGSWYEKALAISERERYNAYASSTGAPFILDSTSDASALIESYITYLNSKDEDRGYFTVVQN